MHILTPRRLAVALAAFCLLLPADAGDTFKWTVQYVVDNSQVVFGQPQKVWPRRNRGLAISPDGKFLYAGYHHGPNGGGEVRKLAIGMTDDFTRATVRSLQGPLGKAIACDDKGRVYIANEGDIEVYDANLNHLYLSIPVSVCEGVATVREGGDLILYGTDRQLGLVQRWKLTEKDDVVTEATPAGFEGDGVLTLPSASSLRGMEIDAKGNLWVADVEGNQVFRISKDGKTIDHVDVESPVDVAIDGSRILVSRGIDRLVAVIDAEALKLVGNLAIPWDELELTPTGNNRLGRLGSIVAIPGKGFFVTNESGQTAAQRSTYGRADESTDFIEGKLYRDAYGDDNDPILRAVEVSGQ